MSFINYAKLPFSFHDGWDELGAARPSLLKTFLLLVLPFSLIPPAMLIYAGSHHASLYLLEAPSGRWQVVASVFLIAELLTVPLMSWVVKTVASAHKIPAEDKETFLLAGVTAVPMWLSSLGLAIPSMWAMIGLIMLGLFLSASVLYHGAYSLLKMKDKVEAQALSFEVFSTGALVWALLCAFVVLPLVN